ncbi:hypothetical protein Ocin01_04892 [Orchesella cincta]|uniref:Uncharacterized protein n=1 Tax=Orchesella cincta TaxID=48709 RepID=A0A1D2N967_ORCCI|nr:hypothetical protein Ocin01_04892 [Orchesella cincta]
MKLILALCLFACVGFAVAGYGSGTPGYYDPWTYYGGYDRYSYRRPQPRPYGEKDVTIMATVMINITGMDSMASSMASSMETTTNNSVIQ